MAKTSCSSKLVSNIEMVSRIPVMRARGMVVVATSGVFDLWHEGHAHYLEDAGQLGDVLIVGVDSDAKVSGRKGQDRPIYGQDMRRNLVASCGAVDYALIMDDWPAFMHLCSPHIIVVSPTTKDADTIAQRALAARVGADLVFMPSRSQTHTSDIIRRIVKVCA